MIGIKRRKKPSNTKRRISYQIITTAKIQFEAQFEKPNMSQTQKPKTTSKGELARAYGVHISTLNNWLTLIPDLDLRKGQRVLTPKQVGLIIEHLGEP